MLYKEKNDIIAWLDKNYVKNYSLVPDETYGYKVDIIGHVCLGSYSIKKIPIKFGHVNGSFYCDNNQLTSLDGTPDMVDKNFWCHENKLTSLKGAPESVGGDFDCNRNKLTSLQAMPETVEGRFYCHINPKLGELQEITDFKIIKSYFLSQKLAMELAHDLDKNNRKIKL